MKANVKKNIRLITEPRNYRIAQAYIDAAKFTATSLLFRIFWSVALRLVRSDIRGRGDFAEYFKRGYIVEKYPDPEGESILCAKWRIPSTATISDAVPRQLRIL